MTLSNAELSHVLISLLTLVCAAHLGGFVFRALRQPPVIGEICAGLLLGPLALGAALPGVEATLFTDSVASRHVVGAFYYIGMLLLVYLTGSQLRSRQRGPRRRRTIAVVGVVGLAVPFVVGVGLAALSGTRSLSGPAGSTGTLALVMGMAVAVTSIPVISRIMMDLGIIDTAFARVVLTIAVLEDVVLYVVLAVIVGIAGVQSNSGFGLPQLVGIDTLASAMAYYTVLPCILLALCLVRGQAAFERARTSRWNVVEGHSPVAFRLICILGLAAVCVGLGIDPLFGALAAGLCAGTPAERAGSAEIGTPDRASSRRTDDTITEVAEAFFIPVYFAVVGLRLDLVHDLDLWFLLWFLPTACVVKSVSVWLGATMAGEPTRFAMPLAVAMNARGGPGIVLASAVYAADIIDASFFTTLVLLSVITSYAAGVWLTALLARGNRDWLDDEIKPAARPRAGRFDRP